MIMTPEQISELSGKLVVKNVSGASVAMTSCGGFTFAVDQEVDLLASATDPCLRAGNMGIAQYMCGAGPHMELCQLIADGKIEIIERKEPLPKRAVSQRIQEFALENA